MTGIQTNKTRRQTQRARERKSARTRERESACESEGGSDAQSDQQSRVTYRVVRRGVLQAAVEGGPFVLVLHEDGGLVGRQEGGGPVQVLVEVVLPLVGHLRREEGEGGGRRQCSGSELHNALMRSLYAKHGTG